MILIEKKKKATDGCEKERVYRRVTLNPTDHGEEDKAFADEEERLSTNGCTPEKPRKNPTHRDKKPEKQEENGEKGEDPCFSAALRILAAGANSTFMVREKLKRKGFSSDEVEVAMEKVEEACLISDRRLMEGYVSSLARKKYYGAYRIRMEVLRKFGREVTETYLEECLTEIPFGEYAATFAEKNKKLERKALIAKLRQRGYGSEEIKFALAALAASADES